MRRDSQQYISLAWWFLLIPGLAITVLALSANLTGDWRRDRFDRTRWQLKSYPRLGPGARPLSATRCPNTQGGKHRPVGGAAARQERSAEVRVHGGCSGQAAALERRT